MEINGIGDTTLPMDCVLFLPTLGLFIISLRMHVLINYDRKSLCIFLLEVMSHVTKILNKEFLVNDA